MDDRIIEKRDPSTAVGNRGGVAFVQENVVHVIEQVVQNRPVRVLADEINATGDGAGGVDYLIGPRRVPMDVHENISLNPGVGAIQVQAVVARPVKDVV